MIYDFNADDVFEMAEQMERTGAGFYREASDRIDDAEKKDLLLGLAQMEEEHEKTFASIRTQLKESETGATVFDPEGEAERYLHALADTRVFFKKQIDPSSLEQILKAAVEAEKDSIIFYLGVKDLVPDGLGKSKIENIIREEMGHIHNLSLELLKLKR